VTNTDLMTASILMGDKKALHPSKGFKAEYRQSQVQEPAASIIRHMDRDKLIQTTTKDRSPNNSNRFTVDRLKQNFN
jgi:hypothetical protein